MAKQDQLQPSGVLKGEGQDEANPVMLNNSFFKTNGLRSQFGSVERLEGKHLLAVYGAPITALHSDLQTRYWVQTSGVLYMVTSLTDEP